MDTPAAPLQRRLSDVFKLVGGTGKAAEIAGVSRNTVYEWSKGKSRVPFDAASALAQAAGVSLDWIASGKVSKPRIETSDLITNVYGIRPGEVRAVVDLPDGFVVVRQLEVRASAGPGRAALPADADDGSLQVAFREGWLRSLGIAPGRAEFLEARGDSMEPTIMDGDLMLVDRGHGDVINGKIYVLVVSGLVLVKRLHVVATGGLMLISDNGRYPTETVPASEADTLSVEGRVAWYGRAM